MNDAKLKPWRRCRVDVTSSRSSSFASGILRRQRRLLQIGVKVKPAPRANRATEGPTRTHRLRSRRSDTSASDHCRVNSSCMPISRRWALQRSAWAVDIEVRQQAATVALYRVDKATERSQRAWTICRRRPRLRLRPARCVDTTAGRMAMKRSLVRSADNSRARQRRRRLLLRCCALADGPASTSAQSLWSPRPRGG